MHPVACPGPRRYVYARFRPGRSISVRATILILTGNARVVMGRLVMKFGGTSVANIDRIRNVARHVKREVDAGHDVAVVVSAMSGKTNELVEWCRDASPMHDAREYDAVVASGEQVTSGLLAIALQAIGIQARSWQGWQIPIRTSDAHASARILEIDGSEIINRFRDRKEVAVIAGFQGINPQTNRITTLGRGGSDTSAVAIAAASCRPLRHLYRRRRRLHHRPAGGSQGAPARQDRVRGHAGTGLPGRQGAAGALGGTRHGARHADLRPFQLRQARGYRPARHAAGHADLQRGGNHGKPRRHRHRLFQGRSPDFRAPDRGQAGRCRRDLRAARGRQYQRRHDRAERLRGRQDHRPHLHRSGLRLYPRPRHHYLAKARSAISGSTAPPTSQRSP